MRKLGLLVIVIAALALVPAASWAGITGTAHDLKGAGYGTDQICIFCHTPHNAKTPQLAPLWNHASAAGPFTLYSSTTLQAVPGQPAGVSKACLSCHDGVTAIDAYGANTTGTAMTGSAALGTNLSDDHPVSITFDAALATADGGLFTPENANWVDAGTHKVPLYAAKLECGSCHNVHDDTEQPFLRKSNAASALCLTCHNK
jgi:predicted CXXCH cytochrome family protein